MKYLNFGSWFLFVVTALVLAGGSVHAIFGHAFPAFGISENRATAGGYSMEVVVSMITFVMVLWRVIWAVEITHSLRGAADLLRTRTAVLSMGIAGLVGMTLINRTFWWVKHMFTSEAYSHTEYAGAANSTIVSILLCVVVFALHAEPEEGRPLSRELPLDERKSMVPRGTIVAGSIWFLGLVAFFLGCVMYSPP
jgi:hypothetical protein